MLGCVEGMNQRMLMQSYPLMDACVKGMNQQMQMQSYPLMDGSDPLYVGRHENAAEIQGSQRVACGDSRVAESCVNTLVPSSCHSSMFR